MLNNLRCLALIAAALLGLQSVEAAEKAPAAKDTVVLQRVPVQGTDRELGVESGKAVQRQRSTVIGKGATGGLPPNRARSILIPAPDSTRATRRSPALRTRASPTPTRASRCP
jgi:hypothetical protein